MDLTKASVEMNSSNEEKIIIEKNINLMSFDEIWPHIFTSITENKELFYKDKDEIISLKTKKSIIYKTIFKECWSHVELSFSYKYKNYNLLEFFNNIFRLYPLTFTEDKLSSNDIVICKELILKLLRVGKSQDIFKKINLKKIFSNFDEDTICVIYFESGVSSTLPVFLQIEKFVENKKYIDKQYRSIISAAARNSDIRVLKHVVEKFDKYHNHSNNNIEYIRYIITQSFSFHIPEKYMLRRIKILNTKIDFSPYFYLFIECCPSFETLITLFKFYGNNYIIPEGSINSNMNSLLDFCNSNTDDINEESEKANKIVNMFAQNNHKFLFLTKIFLKKFTTYNLNIFDYYDTDNLIFQTILISFSKAITHALISGTELNIKTITSYPELKRIFTICPPELITVFFSSYKINRMLVFMPYINYYEIKGTVSNKNMFTYAKEACIKLNFIKYGIKIWMRRNQKIIRLHNKFKEQLILQDTGKKDQVISSNQKFSSIPPRHILPYELLNLNGTDEGVFLIREKADGTLVDFIPKDVEPITGIYNSHITKSEFIEDLDLYLIFDINLPDTGYINRHKTLRLSHPDTVDDDLKEITSFNQLKEEIKLERQRFKKFLEKPYNNYRVYPKAAWLVKENSFELSKDIIESIICEEDYKFICDEGEYINDGLIVTPLDGSRELKIKPRHLHTIDAQFIKNNWVDREGNILDFIKGDGVFTDKTIWRCHPTFSKDANDKFIFEPREFRFDKEKPNKSIIVNTIYNLHLVDWKNFSQNDETINYFYHMETSFYSEYWKSLTNLQNDHLRNILSMARPDSNCRWLDLGCGSARLLKFIKKYNPKEYNGIDFDIINLLKATKRIDNNNIFQNYTRIIRGDLKNWKFENSWNSIESKFDYIVANFSLAHFNSELFWSKLGTYVNNNAIFILNIVNSNKEKEWNHGSSYLRIDNDKVKYKFEYHNVEMEETLIKENEFERLISNYKWKIVNKIEQKSNNLDGMYNWYILKYSSS